MNFKGAFISFFVIETLFRQFKGNIKTQKKQNFKINK